MFAITVVDHVRMDSEHVARNYTVHARAAERFARWGFAIRIVIVSLLAIVTAVSIANLLFPTRPNQIAAIATAGLALAAFAMYAVLGFEARVYAHRALAHRLWLITERYRSLVAEIDDGVVDQGALIRRRDDLIHELHSIYEHGFGVDQSAFESARLPALTSIEKRAA